MKPYAPILVILLLVSTSFVGVSNQVDKLTSEMEEWDEFTRSYFEEHYYPRPYSSEKHILQEKEIPKRNHPGDIWNKTYGGSGPEKGFCLDKTRDGGYIIVGWVNITESHTGDVWLIKTDMNGTKEWDKTFGGPYEDVPHCVRETKDGGFVIAGYYSNGKNGPYDTWLIKTDENGSMLWNWKYKGPYPETFGEYVIELDDGYLTMSNTWDFLTSHIWLVRTDLEGKELWNKTVGNADDYSENIIQTRNKDFVIVGGTWNNFHNQRVLLIKTDANGDILWRKKYDGKEGCGVFETDDGGFIISAGSTSDAYIIKTDKNGKQLWFKSYAKYRTYWCLSFSQTSDGGYVVAGNILDDYRSDVFIFKIDENGDKFWEVNIGGKERDYAECVIESHDRNFVIVGSTLSYGAGGVDIWLIKMPEIENQRPNKPSKPVGSTRIKIGTWYNFTTSSTDPDGDHLYYKWDWGRGSESEWIGPYNGSEPCTTENIWGLLGCCNIRVRAMDEYGGVGDWSDPLAIIVPKIKTSSFIHNLLSWFLERHPLMFPILRQLLNLE